MRALKLERIYQDTITKGNENPLIQYVTGFTLKRMGAMGGHKINQTTEGHPIEPGEVYCISKHGVFRVD
jgi:hypothetical protein